MAGPKKLVVCCDGTWNTPRTNTNIFRTYEFLRQRLSERAEASGSCGTRTCSGLAKDGSPVALFYDQGVGTNWWNRFTCGATGIGLSDNVRDAYAFLAREFEPEAEIYVFGFSRGAYTARSLCGFVSTAGLLRSPSASDILRAYVDLYVTEKRVAHRRSGWSLQDVRDCIVKSFGDLVGHMGGTDVERLPRHDGVRFRFVGVYDTVGALGVPLPQAAEINDAVVGFHDTSVCPIVDHAVHALAVDEKRAPYVPTLWTVAPGESLAPKQTVLQVWFPGVHSDIGGGYDEKEIGDITWDFMMRQAARRGLELDPAQPTPPLALTVLPDQHESLDGHWKDVCDKLKLDAEERRQVGPTVKQGGDELVVAGEVALHPSVVRRLGQRIHVREPSGVRPETYQPPFVTNVTGDCLPMFTEP